MDERSFGLAPHTAVTAEQMLQKSWPPHVGVQLIQSPYSPGRRTAAQLGIKDSSPITFHVAGDTGGVKAPGPQNAVSYAMQKAGGPKPAFLYHEGDVVYYNGDPPQYAPQFYEPYAHCGWPIVAIPGNHDGDGTDGVRGSGINSFLANFCSATAQIPPGDSQLEYGRHTQTQPSHDWTLQLQALTMIGVWTNVPSGGHLEQQQIDWLTAELKAADGHKPVVVNMHHPPLSVDDHHGGSAKMGKILDKAMTDSGRVADVVLSGHVHMFEVFRRTFQGHPMTYVVSGNGGYHNLHRLAFNAKPGLKIGDVTFEYGDDANYGFITLTCDGRTISGEYTQVRPGTMPDGSDAQIKPNAYAF